VLVALSGISDFLHFWLLMEFIILLFMGVSYTVFTNKVSSLIVYFFVQSLSSFFILVSYFLRSPVLFSFSLFLKLGMFPFLFWYLASLSFFPSSLFFVASTFQKLPALFMLMNTGISISFPVLWASAIISALMGGLVILASQSFRFLLVASRVRNGGWLLLSVYSSILSFLVFVTIYFVSILIVLSVLKQFSEVLNSNFSHSAVTSLILLSSFSGLPPSPLFLGKVIVILRLLLHSFEVWPLLFFLVISVMSSSAYVCFSMLHYVRKCRV